VTVPAAVLVGDATREALDAFARETGRAVRLRRAQGSEEPLHTAGDGDGWDAAVRLDAAGPTGAPLLLELAGEGDGGPEARLLLSMLPRLLRHDLEVTNFSRELAERYEEITLLYSISEILGSVISLEAAASTILTEVVSTLGARRAALWLHDAASDCLRLAASVGDEVVAREVRVDDQDAVTAEVFRTRQPLLLEPGAEFPRRTVSPPRVSRDAFLSVPVSYSPPTGETRTTGVINLTGRSSGGPFSAGDVKLLSAIASQVGSALENSRLVEHSLERERVERELELAHDLQLKLLPDLAPFGDIAEVAARCLPADSVGGDFYHLFRLPRGRLGVMIGDVSSHGFSAALIMALTMSAVAIYASEGDPPAEVLRRVHRALIDELQSTEMYMTVFYATIDPQARRLTYANAGHPHAFRVRRDGSRERLEATSPPLGITDGDAYGARTVDWDPGRDLLFLFTDGLGDGTTIEGSGSMEDHLVDAVVSSRGAPVERVLSRVLAAADERRGATPDDRTAVLLRM
jgi:phosphoserine phosphatase RsbU/P